jgi:hypothetical protein
MVYVKLAQPWVGYHKSRGVHTWENVKNEGFKFSEEQVRKPEMSKKVKIHRVLRSCTDLTIKETEFLMQIYGMMNAGKEELLSGKQHKWVDILLNKHGGKHGAEKLSRTSNN